MISTKLKSRLVYVADLSSCMVGLLYHISLKSDRCFGSLKKLLTGVEAFL